MKNKLIQSVEMKSLDIHIDEKQAKTYAEKHRFNTLNAAIFFKWGSFIFAAIFLLVVMISEEMLSIFPVLLLIVLGFVFHNKGENQRIVEAKRILRQHQLATDNQWDYTAKIDGNAGLKGSEFKAEDYKMHSLTDYFQTPNFSFGTYSYAALSGGAGGHTGGRNRAMGIIVIPLHYHFPNNVYIINRSVSSGFPLVNEDNQAKFRNQDTGELTRQKVQQVNVSSEFDETYHTYLKDTSYDAFLRRITGDTIQAMTHLRSQYDIEVTHDEIYIYKTSQLNFETYGFKLYEKADLIETFELIWQMARIFQIEGVLEV